MSFAGSYRVPTGVEVLDLDGRPAFRTADGGHVATDADLVALWRAARDRRMADVVASAGADGPLRIAALACLAEARLLTRAPIAPVGTPPVISPPSPSSPSFSAPFSSLSSSLVSVVIVSYNSEEWLDDCLRSIATQTHTARDIVLVDNGSREDPTSWVCAHHPAVRVVRLPSSESLAVAINRGCAAADGRYFLILNPDVVLEPDAIRAMVEVADADPGCAAVAPKLRFWWARPFLNGLGNRVEDESWGTDNAIGHLDLGQFDDWSELPSACYAATLVPRRAWDDVGPADEGFSLYYEDVEWSYRARVLGWRIRAAPDAIVYHAFGSRMASGREHGVEAAKLRHVVYGRRRFAAKLLDTEARGRFLHNYGREDRRNLKHALRGRHWAVACAYARGYADYISHLSEIRAFRRAVHARRRLSDHDLLAVQTGMPPGLTWRGVPELTMRIIDRVYRPLLEGRRTRPVPEFGLD